MPEWGSYGLRDLLMFSPQTYYRLFELYNAALWPAQLVALAVGLLALPALLRAGDRASRGVLALLALAWLAVAWWFFWQRYARINLAAPYFAGLFLLESALLLRAAWLGSGFAATRTSDVRGRGALVLYLVALCLYPFIGLARGRSATQAEVAGLAPDPTALATLAILLLQGGGRFWLLAPIPVLWCLASGATLWAMHSPDFFVAPALATLALVLALLDPGRGRQDIAVRQ
jgi:hypothetical protein